MNIPLRSVPRILSPAALPVVLAVLGLLFFSATTRAGNELIPNDKFADDGTSWKPNFAKGLDARISVEKVDGEPALCVEVSSDNESEPTPENVPLARIERIFGEISTGTAYHINFKAKADKDASIVSFVSPDKEGARVLWRMDVKLDSEWREFTYNYTGSDTASNCVFGFSRLGNSTNKFWFKDVVLTAD